MQEDFSGAILKTAFETGILSRYCQEIKIGSNSNTINMPSYDDKDRSTSRLGGVVGGWLGEGSELTATKPTLRQVKLVLHKLACLAYATDELIQDSTLLQQIIMTGFTQEMGFQLDKAILSGSGSGEPLGILNSDALITVDAET